MVKVNLELKEIRCMFSYFRTYFKVVADEPTKALIKRYIDKVGSKYESEDGYVNWNLKEDILEEKPFTFIFFNKKEWLEELSYLKEELQRFADKEEKLKENTHHIRPKDKFNIGSVLKPKEESNKYTGYTVKLNLTDVENTFRNLIEEYTTELNKPKYTQEVDFVKILDSIKEAIKNKDVTVVDCMAFVSDLNDYLTDLVAGFYNA
nr:MAG TPA: hypothetical protein [Ackermannviridae sp.]